MCLYDKEPIWPELQKSVTLTKAKLAGRVQKRIYGVKPREARRLVETVMEIIRDTLAHGEDVLVSVFGKFEVRRQLNSPPVASKILVYSEVAPRRCNRLIIWIN